MQQAFHVVYLVNFCAFVVAAFLFSFFWAREQKQSKFLAILLAVGIIFIAVLLTASTKGWALPIAAAVAADYVAVRKSRSRRAWWVSTFFLGPVLLVILLVLPSLMGRSRFPILPSQFENLDKPFLMPIQHTRIQASMLPTFAPAAQGMIAAGQVERGKVRIGQEVEVVGLRPEALKQVVGRIGNGALRQRVDEGWPGDTVGIFLKGAQKEDVKRGMVLATPGSIAAHTRFTPEIHTGTEQEGGRDVPLLAPRTLQFTFRGFDVTGLVKPPPGTGTVTPGSSVVVEVELTTPIAIDKGLQFPVREVGGDNVGNGTVVDILL